MGLDQLASNINIYGIIYKIINLINEKKYIGQTVKLLDERWYEHIRWGKNNDLNHHLYNSMRKYDAENFKIEELLKCYSREDLDFFEDYYIIIYDTMNPEKGYNKMRGGWGFHGYSSEVIMSRTKSYKKYLSNPKNKNKIIERNKKISKTVKEYSNRTEVKKEFKERMEKWHSIPENKEKHRKATKEAMDRYEIKEKMKKQKKVLSNFPEIKERFKKRMEKYWSNPENRIKQSERMKKYYKRI